jgi:hypothetical protein
MEGTMDKYNHWLARIFLVFHPESDDYAVTLGQTAYYSCPAERVSLGWHAHENKHKEQFRRDGWIKFLVRYVWWSLRYRSHDLIPYEIEADEAWKATEGE